MFRRQKSTWTLPRASLRRLRSSSVAERRLRRHSASEMEARVHLACSQNLQPVQRNRLGFQRLDLDFGCRPFGPFEPAVNTGFGLFAHVAARWTQEVARVIERSSFARGRPRERFDGIAPQKFGPVRFE